MAITAHQLLTYVRSPWGVYDYILPWRQVALLPRDTESTIQTEKDIFQINLDMQNFLLDEIIVKAADRYVIVKALHKQRKEKDGTGPKRYQRRYTLPEGVESENVISELSSDAILTLTAPRKVIDDNGLRLVPITKTGPALKDAKFTKNMFQDACESSDQSCNKLIVVRM